MKSFFSFPSYRQWYLLLCNNFNDLLLNFRKHLATFFLAYWEDHAEQPWQLKDVLWVWWTKVQQVGISYEKLKTLSLCEPD